MIAARIPSDLEVPRVTGAGVGAASGRRTSFRGAGISSVAPTVFRCSANSVLVAVVSLLAVAASGAWAVTRRIGRLASVETVSTVASESGMSRPAVDTGVGVSPTPPVVEVDSVGGRNDDERGRVHPGALADRRSQRLGRDQVAEQAGAVGEAEEVRALGVHDL